ncbi:MAG: alpha/beta fold hydrolase [Thermoleophilia bacterium]
MASGWLRRTASRLVFGAALAVTVAPAAAQTPLRLAACDSPRGFQCGSLTVPLNRAAPDGVTRSLAVRVLPASGTARGTLVFLAGGPGQAALGGDGGFERFLRRGMPGYRVVVFNQRGTGQGALRCPSLNTSASTIEGIADAVGACAQRLGEAGQHHTTEDSVGALEQLRQSLGAERISILGVSYGTLVATWYARRHPLNVDRLILDSLVPPQGTPVSDTSAYDAARRAMSELCRGRRCAGVTRNIRADVAALERRLAVKPLIGRIIDSAGRAHRAEFGGPNSPTELFEVFEMGDLSAAARGAFPAAVKLALRGDPSLLFRISGAGSSSSERPDEFSTATFLATSCAESAAPWTRQQSLAERVDAARAVLDGIPAEATTPFRQPGLDSAAVIACIGWPDSPNTTPPADPVPDVPTLILSGTQDVRTSLEGARSLAAALPRPSLVRAVGAGHSVISTRPECVATALRRFTLDQAVGAPCTQASLPPITPVPPASVRALRPLGISGIRGRTLRAAVQTVADVSDAVDYGTAGPNDSVRFTGLRGGRGSAVLTSRALVIRFTGYRLVPGALINGTVRYSGGEPVTRISVSGSRVAPARLVIRGRHITGVVGGRRVDITRWR